MNSSYSASDVLSNTALTSVMSTHTHTHEHFSKWKIALFILIINLSFLLGALPYCPVLDFFILFFTTRISFHRFDMVVGLNIWNIFTECYRVSKYVMFILKWQKIKKKRSPWRSEFSMFGESRKKKSISTDIRSESRKKAGNSLGNILIYFLKLKNITRDFNSFHSSYNLILLVRLNFRTCQSNGRWNIFCLNEKSIDWARACSTVFWWKNSFFVRIHFVNSKMDHEKSNQIPLSIGNVPIPGTKDNN